MALSSEEAHPLPTGRVLVVDDDRAVGAAAGRMLTPLEPTFAQSASGALARVQAGARFEAVVCDVAMPGMSGAEFYEELVRVAPELAHRIVFITGWPTTAIQELVARTNCLLVEKPFDRASLRRAVAAAVERP